MDAFTSIFGPIVAALSQLFTGLFGWITQLFGSIIPQ